MLTAAIKAKPANIFQFSWLVAVMSLESQIDQVVRRSLEGSNKLDR
jgi:hypothetical protein